MSEGRVLTLDEILKIAMEKGASDVHLKAGIVPVIRKHSRLRPLDKDLAPLTSYLVKEMAFKIMTQQQQEQFLRDNDIDMGYGIAGLGRFRINTLMQRGTIRMVIRNIPHEIPTFEQLHLPEILKSVADFERGMVLVTGATGSGKSSTLAAIIDEINKTKNRHILMIEDPIEYLVRDRKCLITQRELGTDTNSYSRALRAALRQDPDVILIGEMRDRETIEIALLAAETGHLVFSTLHTIDSVETINRILAAFEPHQQKQIRLQLSSVLKAIISQRLIRTADKKAFVPAVEIMVANTRIREMIVEPEKTTGIKQAIEESGTTYGMQTFDQSLIALVKSKQVTYEEALKMSSSPEDFAIRYAGVSGPTEDNWGNEQFDDKKWEAFQNLEVERVNDDPSSEEKTRATRRKRKS